MMDQLITVLDLGIIYGLLAVSVYLTFRVLDFPDLTVDGSFVLGGALSVLLIKNGVSPYLALILPCLGGILAGLTTATLHLKFKINGILASILVMTMLYSINLRILGSANVSIFSEITIFGNQPLWTNIAVCLIFLIPMMWLFQTYLGLILIAVGQNEQACRLYKINTTKHKYFLIALSNGVASIIGALMTQHQGFCDISMGFGVVIIALACIMLGEIFAKGNHNRSKIFMYIILGSIIYRAIIQIALNLDDIGLKTSDLKLITSVMVIASIILSNLRKRGYYA